MTHDSNAPCVVLHDARARARNAEIKPLLEEERQPN